MTYSYEFVQFFLSLIIITFTTTTAISIILIMVRIIILIMVRIPPGGRQGPAQHPQGWRRVGPLKYCTLSNSDENSDEGWDDDQLYGKGCCSDGRTSPEVEK